MLAGNPRPRAVPGAGRHPPNSPPRRPERRAAAGRREATGGRAPGARLLGNLKCTGIDKKISPHKLRHTCAINPLDAGAELVDIKALLGRERIATARIYTDAGQERMEKVVRRL